MTTGCWRHAGHEQDLIGAQLLTAVKGGGSLAAAAALVDVKVQRSPPIARSGPTPGIPPELVQPLFATAVGEADDGEAAQGFWIAVPVSVQRPDPAADRRVSTVCACSLPAR